MKILARKLITFLLLVLAMAVLRITVDRIISSQRAATDALGEQVLDMPPAMLATVTTFAFLLLGAWLAGMISKMLALPKITGYLLFGVVVGPEFYELIFGSLTPIVSAESINNLSLVNDLAIAIIGLTAGGEIRIGVFRKGFGAVVIIASLCSFAAFAGLVGLMLATQSQLDLLKDLAQREVIVIAMMVGVIGIANSPAIVIAMLAETGARGKMTEIGLAVTVCVDLFLVILFTIATALGIGLLASGGESGEGLNSGHLIGELAWHLLGSVAFGAAVGVLLASIIDRVGRRMPMLVLASALGIALFSAAVGFESLLAALTAGFVLANVWPVKSEPLFHTIEELSTPIYCVFFAITGTKISLEAVAQMWPLAVAIVVVRAVMMGGGTALGCLLAKQSRTSTLWMWTMFIPNAGVAIALTNTLLDSFQDYPWAAPLVSLLLATIAINQLLGPILTKHGLVKSGEIPS